ncbi:hypothetical protein CHARACLAT_030050 [Characodon lateralis]|uniref:FHF complex subunit HOOK-interacting protein C-terminal domain-containing protein n=1 Tax=Characodon lateralis TaxID=208331 RepID=A0ABU7DP33_9TELE|nr:hypothetical protein [Characodon lateralis]
MIDCCCVIDQDVEDTGPCLEYLLQHKLLETLCTLGKAQYPPGMSQQVLLFFFKLLSQMQKPLLQLVPVYRPVQKLIGLCALPGSCTEKEEAQFLLAVCTRVTQDPSVLRYVLQLSDRPLASGQSQHCSQASNQSSETPSSQSESLASSPVQSEHGLLWVLLQLSRSQRSKELDAAELRSWPRPSWRSESQPDHVTNFLTWFDFLDHLTREAPQVLSVQVCRCVRQLWLVETLYPQLLHTCEQDILVSTSVLCSAVRLVQSPSLLDQLLDFLLRTPSLMELLLQRCDHISDQISMVSLSLVDELLQKPHRDILDTLVLSFVQTRSYLSLPVGGQEDRQPESSDDGEDTQDLEDDPFFSDGFPDEHLAHHHHHHQQQPAAPGSAADMVNSFLCLVPVQARSAHLVQEGGYESYVHDARSLVTQCQSLSLSWDWPQTLPPPGSSGKEGDFFEGHLLRVLFERLGRVLQQPYKLNLQLTAILSRLSAFNHPLLDEYLLDPYIHLSSCSRSLFSVLVRVMGELMQRIQQVSGLSERLLDTRRHLLGLNQHTGNSSLKQ